MATFNYAQFSLDGAEIHTLPASDSGRVIISIDQSPGSSLTLSTSATEDLYRLRQAVDTAIDLCAPASGSEATA